MTDPESALSRRAPRRWAGLLCALLGLFAAGAILSACSGPERPARARDVPVVVRDLPEVLRGTVGSEVTIRGMQPTVVSGFGLVVNLRGTGSGDVPISVRSVMETEMRRLGIGNELAGPYADITPGQLIDDPNTAVVLVQAIVPPGMPEGSTFDVRISAFPGSSTTSLEGGNLYTTALRRGVAQADGPDTPIVAEARGPVFVNPFDGEGAQRTLTRGTVLSGGVVTQSFELAVLLDNPSHARAREITRAINQQFPSGEALARGLSDETIALRVPRRYRDDPDEFLKLVRFTRIERGFPETWARRYAETLTEQPELAEDLGWALRALGPVSLPFVRPLYDFPELRPRLTAIEVGAYLGDLTARPHLESIARSGPLAVRANAIRLMARLPTDGRVNRFLRDTLNDEDLEMRTAAYEALLDRGDPFVRRYRIDDKFNLDIVPSARPMIYVSQQGAPTIALFGDTLEVATPVFVEAWDGRLLINAAEAKEMVEVFYRDPRTGRSARGDVEAEVEAMLRYMAHETTPEAPAPGLDMTYTEIVGALAAMVESGAVDATFLPERDRIELALIRAGARAVVEDRPEFSDAGAIDELTVPDEVLLSSDEPTAGTEDDEADAETRDRSYVVPLSPPPSEGDRRDRDR